MSSLLHILKTFLFILSILMTEYIVSYLFPYPLYTIHVPTVIAVAYLFLKEKRHIIWYMLVVLFLVELLSPTGLFGSVFVPGVLSTLIVYWCHRFFFTNRSLYTGAILGAIMLVSFRSMHMLYTFIGERIVTGTDVLPAFSLRLFGIELIATEIALLIVLSFLLKQKNLL